MLTSANSLKENRRLRAYTIREEKRKKKKITRSLLLHRSNDIEVYERRIFLTQRRRTLSSFDFRLIRLTT